MSGSTNDAEKALYGYMVGWRIGARGGMLTSGMAANPDVAKGHEAGRKAQGAAYREASRAYGAELSPLRQDAT